MQAKPFFREFDGWWYIQTREGGKRRQIKLAKGRENESAAYDRWHELGISKPTVDVGDVVGLPPLFQMEMRAFLRRVSGDVTPDPL